MKRIKLIIEESAGILGSLANVNIRVLVMAFAISLFTVSCGGSKKDGDKNGDEPCTVDVTQFTAVEVPQWNGVEAWMIPADGVVTFVKVEEGFTGMYRLSVAAITTVQVDSYRAVLKSHGLTETINTYKNDKVEISLNTDDVCTTKNSYMSVYITVKQN